MHRSTKDGHVYSVRRNRKPVRGYSALPSGLAQPMKGQGANKWFLNCAHGPAPFVCPSCGHAYAGVHRRGDVCVDCSTEVVMENGSWLERELGIELGCKTQNIDGGRNVLGRRTGRRTNKTGLRHAI